MLIYVDDSYFDQVAHFYPDQVAHLPWSSRGNSQVIQHQDARLDRGKCELLSAAQNNFLFFQAKFINVLQEFCLPWRFIEETRKSACIKHRLDAEASKPKDRKYKQLDHLNALSRDKPDNEVSLLQFFLTGQMNDCLIDAWVPRSVGDKADPLNGFLKSLGLVMMPLMKTEQEAIDTRMETLLHMQYNLTLLNYLDGVLVTRKEVFTAYVKSVARMAAGGFLKVSEWEIFQGCHASVLEDLGNMQASCRYYLELCPKAKEFFPEPDNGSSFDPDFALSERTRIDALLATKLKKARPIKIDRPQYSSVSENLSFIFNTKKVLIGREVLL